MSEMFRVGRINKITETHSEMLSDATILNNIVNSMDAKKNLTPEKFAAYQTIFYQINQNKEERSANKQQYQYRALAIAYAFESAGVSYCAVCGDASEIRYAFERFKPHLQSVFFYISQCLYSIYLDYINCLHLFISKQNRLYSIDL